MAPRKGGFLSLGRKAPNMEGMKMPRQWWDSHQGLRFLMEGLSKELDLSELLDAMDEPWKWGMEYRLFCWVDQRNTNGTSLSPLLGWTRVDNGPGRRQGFYIICDDGINAWPKFVSDKTLAMIDI